MKNTRLLSLKANICGHQHVGHQLRNRISHLSGARRHEMRLYKRDFGELTRAHLIAYGLMRGVPYERIENRCGKNNLPPATRVYEIIRIHCMLGMSKDWSLERVESLLERGEDA